MVLCDVTMPRPNFLLIVADGEQSILATERVSELSGQTSDTLIWDVSGVRSVRPISTL